MKCSMRLFIAIQLSEDMKREILRIQEAFRRKGVSGNYTKPENLHLTLAFIGEHPDAEPILDILETLPLTPFEMSLEGIGAFGDLWWAGIEDSAPLQAVVRRLRRALAEADIPFDRKKFSPHITLIRRANGRLSDASKEEMAEHFDASIRVNHISLMRSDRGKHGMIYTEL